MPADSTLVDEFFDKLESEAHAQDGCVLLPSAVLMDFYGANGTYDNTARTMYELLLRHEDW